MVGGTAGPRPYYLVASGDVGRCGRKEIVADGYIGDRAPPRKRAAQTGQ